MKTGTADAIAGRFLEAARAFPDNTAFHYPRDGWKSITYREFSADVFAVAALLREAGFGRADRAVVISENKPMWCAAYLGIIMAGGIAVPIDAQLGAAEIRTLLDDAGPRVVFHSDATGPGARNAAAAFPSPDILLINIDSAGYNGTGADASSFPVPESGDEEIASIIYTSGTTGSPKGVMLTHANFCSDAQALIDAGLVSHDDNVLSVLPLHHTYAFMCTFLVPVFLGASITYSASLKGPDVLSAVRDNGVTVVIGVPQLLGLIRNGVLNRIKGLPGPVRFLLLQALRMSGFLRERFNVNIGRTIFHSAHAALGKRFRFFGSGGARLDPSVMKDLEALGFTVLEGYGLTETSPVVTFNPLQKRKPGSAGKPLPSVRLQILSPDEKGEGEIAVSGPMVMKGYYKNPSATAAVFFDGWFRTGDVGRLDSDGYLFITGRTKEVIVLSSGKNIYPEDVEKLYGVSPLIREICVIGVAGKDGGEVLRAVIVPDVDYAGRSHITDIHEALKWEINELSGKIPPYMRLTGFTVRTDPLPRTPLGKIRRFMVAAGTDRLRDAVGKTDALEMEADETARLVLRELARFLREGQTVRLDDNLELDIGLDSLSKIELTVVLEKTFSVKLAEDFLAYVHTVRELVEKLKDRSPTSVQEGTVQRPAWKDILSAELLPDDLRLVSFAEPQDRMFATQAAYSLVQCLFRLCFRLEARGSGHIPSAANFIMTPNHTSYLDGFVAILCLPFGRFRNIYALGLSEFFTGFLRSRLSPVAHVIPIDTASYLNKALQMSAHVLKNNRSLCVFPEGGRSFDGELMEFKKGVGILAKELGAPVVPVYIDGAFEALPRYAFFPRFRKITVFFGPPLRASDLDFSAKPEGMDDYQYFANVLRERVEELRETARKQ